MAKLLDCGLRVPPAVLETNQKHLGEEEGENQEREEKG